LLGLWWLDPAAAIVIALAASREGAQAWRGEGCCASALSAAGVGHDHAAHDGPCA
jgi:hypothetical protein